MFQGMKHVTVYLDDILITGCTKEEHLKKPGRGSEPSEICWCSFKEKEVLFHVPAGRISGAFDR